jgi:hypothetical protein
MLAGRFGLPGLTGTPAILSEFRLTGVTGLRGGDQELARIEPDYRRAGITIEIFDQ